eukprot:6210337-Pleurochrysis_carterae.AAC.1
MAHLRRKTQPTIQTPPDFGCQPKMLKAWLLDSILRKSQPVSQSGWLQEKSRLILLKRQARRIFADWFAPLGLTEATPPVLEVVCAEVNGQLIRALSVNKLLPELAVVQGLKSECVDVENDGSNRDRKEEEQLVR